MVEKSTRCGYHKIHSLRQFFCLHPTVSPSHDDTMGVVVVLEQLGDNSVGLEGELSRGGDDYHARP